MKIYVSRLYGLLGLLIICAILLVGCFDNSNGQANAAGGGTGGVKGHHATPTSTSTSTPTATSTTSASGPTQAPGQSQPAPTSTPPTPTPTPAPTTPNIAGSYSGSYTWNGSATTYPMQLQLSQSGSNLTGTTTEGSVVYNDTGTIDTNGNFTIKEYSGGSLVAYLYGSTSGNQLSGTWLNTSNSGGNWSVSK